MAKAKPPADADTLAYRRVSKGEQAAEWKSSLRQQTEAVTALATRLGRTLRPECIFEDRFSGEDADDREGFMAIVRFCRAHPRRARDPGYILFLNDTRFGRFRDPDEAAYWRFELSKHAWIVRFAENDETDHPTTRHVMRAVGGAQGSEYLVNLRRNAKAGARGAAEAGLWQNEAPFGYRRRATSAGREPVVLDIGQRKSDDQQVRLTPGPDAEVRQLRWMFETYAAGLLSLNGLASEMRVQAPRLKWSKQNVAKMLANQTYLGHVIWCRRPHDKHERREIKVRDPAEWVVTRDAHPPLITQELFDRVQARLAQNKLRTRAANGAYPLSGLILCATCGKAYTGGGGPRGPAEDPGRYRVYRCSGSHDDNRVCPGHIGTISRRVIEPVIIGLISEVVSEPGLQAIIREEIDRYLAGLHGDSEDEKNELLERRKQLEREKGNVTGAIARGVLADEDAKVEMDRIRGGLGAVEKGLKRLEGLGALERDLVAEAGRMAKLAADFPARAAELKGPALHELIAPWIASAVLDKHTRVMDLVIRRVPRMATRPDDAEDEPLPDPHRVRVRVRFPRQEKDCIGRYRTPSYDIGVIVERMASG